MADGGLDAVCREVVCKLYFEDHTLGNNLLTEKKSSFFRKINFQVFEISRHFCFCFDLQKSTHSTDDFYQKSSYFVNKTR